jgi:hypothetical protein
VKVKEERGGGETMGGGVICKNKTDMWSPSQDDWDAWDDGAG